MSKKEAKSRSWRKPLREISNGEESSKPPKKKLSDNEGLVEDDALDRLLLVQSNLSSLINQIDELVAQAFNVKATNRLGRKEIESFTHVLSDMICFLKPWVPKFQKALSSPCTKAENQLDEGLVCKSIPANARNIVESPEESQVDSLISPSPFVSWRGDCTIERGRQLFLLTPLPMSKALSAKQLGSHKSLFESIGHAGIPSFCTISEDLNDNLLQGVEAEHIQHKFSESGASGVHNISECGVASPPSFLNRDCSVLVATPCLKISPPKSCVLLEPISKSSYQKNVRHRKATPFPQRIQNCDGFELSESPTSQVSKSLALKYSELFGIQPADKLGIRRKEVVTSADWFMSPPKTCVLMEPPNERNANPYCQFPGTTSVLKQQTDFSSVKGNDVQSSCYLINKIFNQETEGCSALIECTPMWRREPESIIRTGKRPGETTLKKELWTRFEAASTNELHFNAPVLQRTAQKGFLDRLEEVSCDETTPIL